MVGASGITMGIGATPWVAIVTAPAGSDIRTHPQARAPIVRTVVCGDILRVHGCPCGDNGEWYAVTYDSRQDGYVRVEEISGVGVQ